MITQSYDLSITPNHSIVKVHASQWDSGERQFEFNLYADSIPYLIPTGATIEVRGTKADGHGFAISTSTNPSDISYSGSTITVKTTKQMTAAAGEQDFKLSIISGAKVIASARYTLVVDEDTIREDIDISDTEIPAIIELAEEQLQQATQQAQLSKSYAQGHSESGRENENTDNAKYYKEQTETLKTASEGFSEDSEAWARGTRNGTNVESSDPTYHNNSKYFSELSEESATNSSNSADDASDSAEEAEAWAKGTKNGVDVGSSAPQYHNNSKYYSELSEDSADDSSDSAELSKSWAVGNSQSGRTGENTNNSEYWCHQSEASAEDAENYAELAATYSDIVLPNFYIDFNTMELMQKDSPTASNITFSLDENRNLLFEIQTA